MRFLVPDSAVPGSGRRVLSTLSNATERTKNQNRRTPEPRTRTVLSFHPMRIAIGADHAGFLLKEHLKATLATLGTSGRRSRNATARRRSTIRRSARRSDGRSSAERRIAASCSAAAGRGSRSPPTRYAACARLLCNDLYTARLSRQHNDANVLSMGGRIVAFGLADEILKLWLDTPYEGGRHQKRLDQIAEIENHDAESRRHPRARTPRRSDPEIAQAVRNEQTPPERRPGADRLGKFRQPGGPRSRRVGADEQIRRRVSRASATTAAASSSTSPKRSPSIAPRRCSAPSTPTCSRTPAHRRTWRCISRC